MILMPPPKPLPTHMRRVSVQQPALFQRRFDSVDCAVTAMVDDDGIEREDDGPADHRPHREF